MANNDYFKNKFRESLLKNKTEVGAFVWDEKIPIPIVPGLSDHQQQAFNQVLTLISQGQKRVVLKGSAGVGKTWLADALVKEFSKRYVPRWSDNRVFVTAPTNKALSILRNKVDSPGTEFATVHSALKLKRVINEGTGNVSFVPQYSSDKRRPFEGCVFGFLDECSMLNTQLLNLLESYNFPIIFTGDDKQINPIKEAFSPVFNKGYPEVELTEIVRQGAGNPIIQLSRDLDMIYFKENNVENNKGYVFSDNINRIVENLSQANGTDDLKYLAWKNDAVDNVNDLVRNRIYGDNPHRIEQGETIVFNDPYLDYFTNQELKVEDVEVRDVTIKVPTAKTIYNSSGEFVDKYDTMKVKCYVINDAVLILHESSDAEINDIRKMITQNCKDLGWNWKGHYYFPEQFANFKYSHAITIHKSQGSTYKEVVINIGNVERNKNMAEKQRLLYTAVTRASDLVILNNVR